MTKTISWHRPVLAGCVVALLGLAVLVPACTNNESKPMAANSLRQEGITASTSSEKAPSTNGKADTPKPSGEMLARVWPMYGGTVNRNMVNTFERNLPAQWEIPNKKKNKPGKNIKWAA